MSGVSRFLLYASLLTSYTISILFCADVVLSSRTHEFFSQLRKTNQDSLEIIRLAIELFDDNPLVGVVSIVCAVLLMLTIAVDQLFGGAGGIGKIILIVI